MTDKPEALRLADELTASVGTQSTYSAMQQAAAELRRLHAVEADFHLTYRMKCDAETKRLQAERDAAVADADLHRTRCASIIFSGALDDKRCSEVHQWMRDYVDAKAERDALLAEVERLKRVNYDMAGDLTVMSATKQIQAAIDAAKDEK